MDESKDRKYNKRITGLFGIQMPPRKSRTYKAYLPMHFVLTGNLPAKKNNWIPASNIRKLLKTAAGKPTVIEAIKYIYDNVKHFLRPSAEFVKWENEAKLAFAQQASHYAMRYSKYGLIFPVQSASLSLYCYYCNNNIKDNANRLESIQDVLTDVGIIISDSWQTLNKIHVEAENYYGEITKNIFVITLTINFESSLKEMEEDTINSNGIIADTDFTIAIPNKRDKKHITNMDLIQLGWYGFTFDESGAEQPMDETPHPDTWQPEDIEMLLQLGYDVRKLQEYYKSLRWDD